PTRAGFRRSSCAAARSTGRRCGARGRRAHRVDALERLAPFAVISIMTARAGWRVFVYGLLVRLASLFERAAKGLLYVAAACLTEAEFTRRLRLEYNTYRATDEDALAGL